MDNQLTFTIIAQVEVMVFTTLVHCLKVEITLPAELFVTPQQELTLLIGNCH